MTYVPTPPPETPWPCPEGVPFKYGEDGLVVCLTETIPPTALPQTGSDVDFYIWAAVGAAAFIGLGIYVLFSTRKARTEKTE